MISNNQRLKRHRIEIRFFLLLILALAAKNGLTQVDSSSVKDSISHVNDSINNAILKEYNRKLNELEDKKREDSIHRAELESELQSLKSSDRARKQEIQQQINDLEQKEEKDYAVRKKRIDSLRANAQPYPVIGFFEDTLFVIYNRLGSFSADDRSVAISNRIQKLADQIAFRPDSLKLSESITTTDIMDGDRVVMSISENDAIWENTTRDSLASKYKDIIGQEVMRYKAETNWTTLLREVGLAILVLLLLGFAIFYINRLFRWTGSKIQKQEQKSLKGVRIKNYTLFDASAQTRLVLGLIRLIKWVLIILLIYIAFPIIFGFFPWTRNLADLLIGWVTNPVKRIGLSVWNYLPNLFTLIVLSLLFHYIIKGLGYLRKEIELGYLKIPGFFADWANPTFQILRVLLYAFMFVLMFPYLPGSDSPIFQGVSVFLGFLLTFGSAGSLANLIAGLILTYMRLFKIGDRVKIGEVVGDVVEKSLLVTRIRTTKNEIISIPNSTIMNNHTVNYSAEAPVRGLIIHSTVTIGYDVPWKDMHQALIDAALRTERIQKDPAPFVLQTSLDDYYVSYQINAYTKEPGRQSSIYSDLHQNIQDVCKERGIEIMSPHYRAMRDGNASTIPTDNHPDKFNNPISQKETGE